MKNMIELDETCIIILPQKEYTLQEFLVSFVKPFYFEWVHAWMKYLYIMVLKEKSQGGRFVATFWTEIL